MMSLIKFSNRSVHRGKPVYWNRATEDGAPFRGPYVPFYTQEEFEQRVTKVADPHAEIFDITVPDQKASYLGVLDGIVNGWFQCVFVNRQFDHEKKKVYIEWVEYFLEDGHPTPYLSPGMMELADGQQPAGLPGPLLQGP